jgi:ABC-type amino acid transport substrate-binding protein
MFTGLFIMAGFIASITSTLTLTSFKANIETIEDLRAVKSIGTISHSNSVDFLERNKLEVDQFYQTAQKGIQSLINDEIDVLVFDRTTLRYIIDEGNYNNRAVLLPVKFNSQYRSFLFPEDSPLIDQINPVLVDILNDPIWAQMMKRYNLFLNE